MVLYLIKNQVIDKSRWILAAQFHKDDFFLMVCLRYVEIKNRLSVLFMSDAKMNNKFEVSVCGIVTHKRMTE